MSDFAALNTALSGLIAHRRASEQIGQNIANVNTEGYSRTRLEMSSSGGGPVPAVFARQRTQGDGVKVDGLLRIRDEFLERRAYSEIASGASLARQKDMVSRVESALPEPSDTGLAKQLSDFWSGWDDVANNPSSLGTRTQLLERATTVAGTLNRASADLTTMRNGAVDQIGVMVTEVNANLDRIAELNNAVQNAVNSNLPANDLQDQRDVLVEKVVKAVGATTRDLGNGQVEVRIAGSPLVDGVHAHHLSGPVQTAPPTGDPTLDAVGWARVDLQFNGTPISPLAGELNGLLDAVNRMLPNYLNQLNQIATKLATDVNTVHATGWGLNDSGPAPARAFFALTPGGGAAAGIGLTTGVNGVQGNPANVAVSNGAGLLDGSVGQQLAKLHNSTTGSDATYRSLIAGLGVESQTTQRRSAIQDAITTQANAQRKSVSGVNLDEEMVNLTMSQHAYSASARLMTTIDQMIQTLINLGH